MKPAYNEDDDDSQEWDRIKSFVGGANKKSKHPLVQEAERAAARKPEHMADGGIAGDFDVDGGDSATLKLNGIVPQGTIPPIPTAPPPVAPPLGVPPPPTGVRPPLLADGPAPTEGAYEDKASKIMGGVTPEAIQALLDNVIEQGKRGQVGAGIAGIGDAIASVGGQNPGHMKNAEDRIAGNRELALKLPGEMATIGKERYTLSKELQGDDPNSPFSKTSQRTYGPDLMKMGITQEEVAKMPASLINDLFAKKVTLEEAKARIQQEGAYQQGMLKNAQAQTQQNAAEKLEGRGLVRRALDVIPGTAGHKAKEVLERQASGESAPPAAGPYGQTTVRDGKTYEWSPETGKYHLKQ